jgi:hypothetical protein
VGYAFRGSNPAKAGTEVELHPVSRKMGTVSLFWRAKQAGRGVDLPPLLAPVLTKSYNSNSPLGVKFTSTVFYVSIKCLPEHEIILTKRSHVTPALLLFYLEI